jgi:predicted metal-dependent phosphoesterase TrpH
MTNRVEADLHLHSLCSDGALPPEEVVSLARGRGLRAVALTDHDTIDGVARARAAAQACGMELVTGIEMTCRSRGRDVHILGYGFDVGSPALAANLARFRERRDERAREMVVKLNALGSTIAFEEVKRIAGAAPVGRPHVARALVASGTVRSIDEAFRKFLSDFGPAFVPASTLGSDEAIALIRAAGGVAVCAHPCLYRGSSAEALVEALASEGLGGIEVWHPKHGVEESRRLSELARRLGLLETGGSDFHGGANGGVAPGDAGVSLEVVERLRAAAR